MLQDVNPAQGSASLLEMRRDYRRSEQAVLAELLPLADAGSAARSRAWRRARDLVQHIRDHQEGKGGVDALLNEFSLSTEEGVVLMCLAEALLRVPDRLTMDRLIRDKLSGGDWSAHLGKSDSLFVNASAWGLLLTGKIVAEQDPSGDNPMGTLRRTLRRLGEPVIRASVRYAMQIMGTQFVLGTNINQALERARDNERNGYSYSYDMLGEGARTLADADRYLDSYRNAIDAIGKAAAGAGPDSGPGISVKLSALHPRYEYAQRARILRELVPRLRDLALLAAGHNIGMTVDAEEADRLELSLEVIETVFADPALGDWQGFGIAVQAYQRRAPGVIDWAADTARNHKRRMMVRLVKGAYWDTEIKIAQVDGQSDFPVFTRKPATDLCYLACARKLLEQRGLLYPQFATHNAYTVASILELDSDHSGYEFQRLHGMGETLYEQIIEQVDLPCRIYAPVGEHADLLAYLVRRLLENGANSSFVNNIIDESVAIESLLEDPVDTVRAWQQAHNPLIANPLDLFGPQRRNSVGADLSNPGTLLELKDGFAAIADRLPLDFELPPGAEPRDVWNPAVADDRVGRYPLYSAADLRGKVDAAAKALPAWRDTPVEIRSQLLDRLAEALEAHRDEWLLLCCKEAGKTLADGVAEIREAADFCRYYAARARQENFSQRQLQPRGVVLCISPWNFPLAIFLGQVTAALAAGNTVVAKPAEQTSLIALRVGQLFRECGFPDGALQIACCEGSTAGAELLPHPAVRAVMFTGSTATGRRIARTLAARDDGPIPLIAETGGQNCMIVDSTALPEQVVDDVIVSGFQSAGQRCSALRVLFVQDEVADRIVEMISGAMQELVVGDPADLATDIGPVIDAPAQQRLQQHSEYLEATGRLLARSPQADTEVPLAFAPRLYEISNLGLLEQEVFGPIVHLIRYRAEDLHKVVAQINASGFGLTFGIHSRIEQQSAWAAQTVSAGNIYINRNMIGAVVGVQPFGGHGLSGTGPKAGGPHYLGRLVEPMAARSPLPQQPCPGAADAAPSTAAWTPSHSPTASAWQHKGIAHRIALLRSFVAAIAAVEVTAMEPAAMATAPVKSAAVKTVAVNTVAVNTAAAAPSLAPQALEDLLSALRRQLHHAQQLLAQPTTLPGPTGESNTLQLEPRGQLLLCCDSGRHLAESLMAAVSALAAGNTLWVACSAETLSDWQRWHSVLQDNGLAAELLQLLPLSDMSSALAATGLAGVLVHCDSAYLQSIDRALAAREGALLALITHVPPDLLLQQMLVEKTVSVDTTAAGGNASLMTLAS